MSNSSSFAERHEKPVADPSRTLSEEIAPNSHAIVIAAIVFACCIAVIDLCTYHVNWPALYFIPLLVIEQLGRRSALWPAVLVLLALTFAGYFLGMRAPEHETWPDMLNSRLANRLLVAGALVVAAALLHAGIFERERRGRRGRGVWPHDPDGRAYDQVVESIDRVVSPLVAGVLVLVLLISDARADAEYNVAILFWLPLVILARARSAVILWVGLVVLIAAALLGLNVGHAPANHSIMNNLLVNRLLVCVAMIGIAALLQGRINRSSSERAA